MRFIAALTGAVAALVVAAQAQETTAPAIPPSSCGALVPAPQPPAAETVTEAQLREGVAGFEAWRVAAQPVLDCRRAEVEALNRQAEARANEYRAAQTENVARATAWQGVVAAFQARQ